MKFSTLPQSVHPSFEFNRKTRPKKKKSIALSYLKLSPIQIAVTKFELN